MNVLLWISQPANNVHRRRETFHTWRTLAATYSDAEEFGQRQYRYLIRLKQPPLPIAVYYKGITSAETKWLTCLRVSPKRLSTQDLVSIHSITNLAVLDLTDTGTEYSDIGSNFDERLMRSWAQLASIGQAFQNLQVILFGWQEELDQWIFNYTDRFPSLCHIIVTDCPKMHQKNRPEWEPKSQVAGWEARHAKRSAKSLRSTIKSEDFAYGSVSGSYYESQGLFAELANRKRPNLTQTLPVLEVWLGTPRQWSHIVDDFPGQVRATWICIFVSVVFRANVYVAAHNLVRQCQDAELGGNGWNESRRQLRANEESQRPGTSEPRVRITSAETWSTEEACDEDNGQEFDRRVAGVQGLKTNQGVSVYHTGGQNSVRI